MVKMIKMLLLAVLVVENMKEGDKMRRTLMTWLIKIKP